MYRDYIKRIIDLILAVVAMPCVLIAIIVMAPIIYFDDHGPVFYCANRRGKNGRTFIMYKFRSMRVNVPDIRNVDGSTFNSATIDDTEIGNYVKIDNLCHIAHNVKLNDRVQVIAGSVVMGSVKVGHDTWIATSIIRDQKRVGHNAVIGMGSVVVKDVPDNITVAGNPAKPLERKEKI